MRRLAVLAVLAAALSAAASGCCSSQLRTLADGVEQGYSEVIKEYEAIVIDGKPRPNFTEKDKEIRRNSLKKVKELLDQARR